MAILKGAGLLIIILFMATGLIRWCRDDVFKAIPAIIILWVIVLFNFGRIFIWLKNFL